MRFDASQMEARAAFVLMLCAAVYVSMACDGMPPGHPHLAATLSAVRWVLIGSAPLALLLAPLRVSWSYSKSETRSESTVVEPRKEDR